MTLPPETVLVLGPGRGLPSGWWGDGKSLDLEVSCTSLSSHRKRPKSGLHEDVGQLEDLKVPSSSQHRTRARLSTAPIQQRSKQNSPFKRREEPDELILDETGQARPSCLSLSLLLACANIPVINMLTSSRT